MNYFSRLDRNEDGSPDVLASAAVNICENCGQTADRLTLVPEFDYLGCDDCMEEAMTVLARERRELLQEVGCTPEEVEAYSRFVQKIEPMQGRLFPTQEVA